MRRIRAPGHFLARFLAPEPPFDGFDGLAGPDVPRERRRGPLPTDPGFGAARSRELGRPRPSLLPRAPLAGEASPPDTLGAPVRRAGGRPDGPVPPRAGANRLARARNVEDRAERLAFVEARRASGGRAPLPTIG
jgi:hypothetical protein